MLHSFPTAEKMFTREKSIVTCLTLSFYERKNKVEYDFTEGLSLRVVLKFGRRLPKLTKLLVPQDF